MKRYRYTLSEQETIINWDNELDTASVYTFDRRIGKKLKELSQKYPDQFILLEKGPQHSVTYRIPKKCVSIRPPYSAKRRKQCVRKSYGRAEDLCGPMLKRIQVHRKRHSVSGLSQSV